ncbi:MAG: glycoside hydrolase family 88 protein [Pseudomonadota bacterium]|nr:glycoside hydrolase family 88 protein [Pseudomonadota bacterium]
MDRATAFGLIDRLVAGMRSLRHDGGFHEPNLDGTAGDYISFDSWEWPQGIGLYGLFRAWEFSDDPRYRAELERWYARQIARGLPPLNVNTTAPMLALSLLWARTGNERWRGVLDDWADRVMAELPRTPEMGFQHIVSDGVNNGELWDDTLFMVCLFLASYGRAAGRPDLVEEAVRQFLVHARFLADPKTGLWFHGWTFEGRHNFARVLWARGNAWVVAAILDLIEIADLRGGVRDHLLGCLRTQIEHLISLQNENGGWHTLLDEPESYVETSATAGISYALLKAARLGIADARARAAGLRAFRYVTARIDRDGVVQGVSYGTRMGHDRQFYRDIPLQPTGYGQALAILLMAEAARHVETVGVKVSA